MILYRLIDSPIGSKPLIDEWTVVKETPHTFVITLYGEVRRIYKHGHFAHQTKEAALFSYRLRKQQQVKIITANLTRAKERLAWASAHDPLDLEPKLLPYRGGLIR